MTKRELVFTSTWTKLGLRPSSAPQTGYLIHFNISLNVAVPDLPISS